MQRSFPERIVCLTEEPTEVLYALGQADRIVGISGFTVRPKSARLEKPKVSSLLTANVHDIVSLNPDLVIGFSDIQADIARELIKAGVEVWISNHRSIEGILGYIRRLGALVGSWNEAEAFATELEDHIAKIARQSETAGRRPKIYFEEWDAPQISAIRWVSQLISVAGGEDIFAELSQQSLASRRIVRDLGEVPRRAPDIIIGSWCGKKLRPDLISSRPGWDVVPAIREGEIHEIKSPIILQPGPAALTDGLDALRAIVMRWSRKHVLAT